MNLNNIRQFYFIGIGGIGMSALARFFHAAGKKVAGYDRAFTSLVRELIREGIPVQTEQHPDYIPEDFRQSMHPDHTYIVYTPAISSDHPLMIWFNQQGYPLIKRSHVLGMITRNACLIAVAGTHGKTTVSTLIAHLLKQSGIDCTAFLGGLSKNYHSNLIIGTATDANNRPVMVVEADEYDRSFLHLFPDCAVITAMDADHLDIYKTHEAMKAAYQEFALQVKENGRMILKKELEKIQTRCPVWSYSLTMPADFSAHIHECDSLSCRFDVTYPGGHLASVSLSQPGHYNVENALAAIAVAKWMNIKDESIAVALHSFQGIRRRFEWILFSPHVCFIDDYAHHPDEITAVLKSVRAIFPEKRIAGLFQPHLFSRTRDFAREFGQSLSLLDRLLLLPIYPARETPIPGVDSTLILNHTNTHASLETFDTALKKVEEEDADVWLTLGAGDIDTLVEPIKKVLESKLKKHLS
jgi:UDP-N-acetylmuramate--alanine ligase